MILPGGLSAYKSRVLPWPIGTQVSAFHIAVFAMVGLGNIVEEPVATKG